MDLSVRYHARGTRFPERPAEGAVARPDVESNFETAIRGHRRRPHAERDRSVANPRRDGTAMNEFNWILALFRIVGVLVMMSGAIFVCWLLSGRQSPKHISGIFGWSLQIGR